MAIKFQKKSVDLGEYSSLLVKKEAPTKAKDTFGYHEYLSNEYGQILWWAFHDKEEGGRFTVSFKVNIRPAIMDELKAEMDEYSDPPYRQLKRLLEKKSWEWDGKAASLKTNDDLNQALNAALRFCGRGRYDFVPNKEGGYCLVWNKRGNKIDWRPEFDSYVGEA